MSELYEPAAFAVLDHTQQTLCLAATSEAELDQLQERLEQPSPSSPPPLLFPEFSNPLQKNKQSPRLLSVGCSVGAFKRHPLPLAYKR